MTKLLSTPRLHDPGDLIAAVPHLLGFHPADSLVLLAVERGEVALTLRVDLPAPDHPDGLAERLVPPLARHPGAVAVAVVVGGGSGDPPEDLPHDALVDDLEEALRAVGTPLVLAVWTRATARAEPWFDYHDAGTRGVVPDPTSTPLAAATAARGYVTHPSREAMAGLLAPDPPELLSHRSELLDRRAMGAARPDPGVRARHRDLVRAEVVRAAGRKRPLTDEEVADLAHALGDPWVRDASLAHCVGEHAGSAEVLWTELTRACPAPERAEPATLLAFSAYLRGMGSLASMALERAEEAHPGHRLSELLREALDTGLPPDRLRRLAEQAAENDCTSPEWSSPERLSSRFASERSCSERFASERSSSGCSCPDRASTDRTSREVD
ncbi:DUF4192 domain-containing protein [Saccharothrix syringae]|uniref:DUF4192 domain-containing protein n=1 Tax=Saccharothrix syringae TaxID=103733 RepID=A0A5Q0GUD9_SACSY|nr:DUF4192 domain-containing protein [Saccharothrix syringae]QFZ17513.1 DUF4192 domain-containing protein [Saccharothrix syringae]